MGTPMLPNRMRTDYPGGNCHVPSEQESLYRCSSFEPLTRHQPVIPSTPNPLDTQAAAESIGTAQHSRENLDKPREREVKTSTMQRRCVRVRVCACVCVLRLSSLGLLRFFKKKREAAPV